MAEATATKKKESKKLTSDQIIEAYKAYTLEHGHSPASVFVFTKDLGHREEAFYDHFGSFEAVQKQIWTRYMELTISALEADKTYPEYSTREKLLAFYFVLIETLTKDRSFIKHTLDLDWDNLKDLNIFRSFREQFIAFIQSILAEGFESGEIQQRRLISDRYKDGLWLQLLFIISFWLKDDSAKFSKTDAAIEKSVNLSYELMGTGPLDRIIDFTKFIWQNR